MVPSRASSPSRASPSSSHRTTPTDDGVGPECRWVLARPGRHSGRQWLVRGTGPDPMCELAAIPGPAGLWEGTGGHAPVCGGVLDGPLQTAPPTVPGAAV